MTHIADGHPGTTLSDAYHGQSPHRHKDSSPKSSKAERNDHMFEHVLRLIEKVPSAAQHALVVIENPRSKAFPRLPGVQQVLVGRPAGVKKRPCPGKSPHLVGNAIKLLTRPIWAPARQRYLVGPDLLTTHRPGHTIKAGRWPSSQRETPCL